jgi:hypothetical protein
VGQAPTPARVLQNPPFGERISLAKPESRPMQSQEPGRPDVVLPWYHAVIFVHDCFWHGHTRHLVKKPATREHSGRRRSAITPRGTKMSWVRSKRPAGTPPSYGSALCAAQVSSHVQRPMAEIQNYELDVVMRRIVR